MRGKIITTPGHINRDDTVKFHNSVRYSQFYFDKTAHDRLKQLLEEIGKYQLTEFKEQLSNAEVVSELGRLADQARDALEPHMSLSR
jgi:hypothetical protein